MSEDNQNVRADEETVAPAEYAAPQIEAVVTPESLEREVQYAGFSTPAH